MIIPQVAQSLLKLAYLLSDDDTQWAEVEPLYRRALDIRRKVYGDGNPWVANTLHDFSDFLSTRGDHARAISLAREYLEIMRRAYGHGHSSVAYATNRLAVTLFHAGELDEAEKLFREAIEIERRARGPNHISVGGHEVELARLLIARGRFDSADSLLRDAIRILESTTTREHPQLREMYGWLADLNEAWSRPAEASRYRAIATARPST